MKASLAAALMTAGLSHSSFAAEIVAQSRLDAVTVFPRGADVTRLLTAQIAADDTTLLVQDLPATADPQSIRVEGEAQGDVAVTSVDSKLVRSPEQMSASDRLKIQEKIEALQNDRANIEQLISDKQAERSLLLGLAQHPAETKGDGARAIDAAAIDALVETVSARLAQSSKVIQDGKQQLHALAKEIAELSSQLKEQPPEAQAHLELKIHVHASQSAAGQFKVTYRVPEAGWRAVYDAKLSLPKAGEEARFHLIREAEVAQHTGETWENVKLTLSTAATSGAASAPELAESEVSLLMPEPLAAGKVAATNQTAADKLTENAPALSDGAPKEKNDGRVEEPAAPVSQTLAQLQKAGFTAQYVIAARGDVDNLGTAKTLRISEDELSAKLVVEAVPRIDANAYLTAVFKAKPDDPLLAGPVHLFRDAAYVGQVAMPELAGGEEAKLGFGVDDLVKIKRSEVRRLSGEEGLISTSNTQEMAWVISVNNLHDVKMPVRILDRKPFSSDEKIIVSDRADNTPATATDVDHKRGVLAWDLNLAPQEKAEIKTGYKISAPRDVRISLVD